MEPAAGKHLFRFPEGLTNKSVFNSPREIVNYLNLDAHNKGIAANFNYILTQHPQVDGQKLNLVCSACKSSLVFKLRAGRLAVDSVDNQHLHDEPNQVQNSQENGCFLDRGVIQKMELITNKKAKVHQQPMRSETVSSKPPTVKPQNPESQYQDAPKKSNDSLVPKVVLPESRVRPWTNSLDSLNSPIAALKDLQKTSIFAVEGQLRKLDYTIKTLISSQHEADSEGMVVVSPTMKRNFGYFGDVVSLGLLQDIIVELDGMLLSQQICLFIVSDTNNRPMIAAIGLLPNFSEQSLIWAIEKAAQIHGHFRVLVTAYDNIFNKAVSRYQSLFPACCHIYDPRLVTKVISQGAKESEEDKRRIVVAFNQMLNTRSAEVYKFNINLLVNSRNSSEVIEPLLSEKQKIFLYEIPGEFVGLKRDAFYRAQQSVKNAFPSKVTLDQFFMGMHRLVEQSSARSSNDFVRYSQEVENYYDDAPLKTVRESFEQEVVKRFLENYTTSISKQLKVIEEFHNGLMTAYAVQSQDKADRYLVRDWQCVCKQRSQTGIPCCHIIKAARIAQVPYVNLFNRRWLKRIPAGKP